MRVFRGVSVTREAGVDYTLAKGVPSTTKRPTAAISIALVHLLALLEVRVGLRHLIRVERGDRPADERQARRLEPTVISPRRAFDRHSTTPSCRWV